MTTSRITRQLRRCVLTLAVLAPACAWAAPSAIYVVRHGEKQATGPNPDLSAQGKARAHNIATLLRHAGIGAVFSSPTARTEQTATPLAQLAGVPVQSYDPGKPAPLVAQVKALAGGAVLVVGHSNTVPELVRLFGGDPGSPIADDEFDRLYQLHLQADGSVRTVLLSTVPAAALQ